VTGWHPARQVAETIGDRLADPSAIPSRLTSQPSWRQSLARGAPGIAVLHAELAAAGLRPWRRAHDWLAAVTSGPVTAGPDSHPFYGAPALAHALACAAVQRPGSCTAALESLDKAITNDALQRVGAARTRMDLGRLPSLAEFDVIRGLAGIGAYLLRRDPGGAATRSILAYMVRLATEPVTDDGEDLPGWWTAAGPGGRPSDRFAGGHSNLGVAHGVGGILALMSKAMKRGISVEGQADAINAICGWLDRWGAQLGTGLAWPFWVSRSQYRSGVLARPGPQRLGWCYGTIGLARAQQLAALAVGDPFRRVVAEDALAQALADPGQRAMTTGTSLCHGNAGLARIAAAAAADAGPQAAARLRALIPGLLEAIHPPGMSPQQAADALLRPGGEPGFLEGAAGVALGILGAAVAVPPRTGWDSCLLIT
jgi:hypothetical protein